MERASVTVKDCFNALNQLRALQGHEAVAPQVLHRRLSELVQGLLDSAHDEGASERNARDSAYAIAALGDEIALSRSGAIESFWRDNLLQTKFFDDTLAGEGFFRRLETLRRDHRRVDVLRTYYLCLLFGFRGVHLGRPEAELRRLTDSLAAEIEQGLELGSELSPDGARPDEAEIRRQERRPLLWIALGALAASLCLYLSLRLVLDGQTDRVVTHLQALGQAAPR
jgi:type VI secretion system protein ImpK